MAKDISKELEFIKGFSKISISSVCHDLNINRSNLLNNLASKKTEQLVYNEIIKRIYLLLGGSLDKV